MSQVASNNKFRILDYIKVGDAGHPRGQRTKIQRDLVRRGKQEALFDSAAREKRKQVEEAMCEEQTSRNVEQDVTQAKEQVVKNKSE